MDKIKKRIESSIKARIMISLMVCIALVAIVLGIASTTASYISTVNTLEHTVAETAELAGNSVRESLKTYRAAVAELAQDALFASEEYDTEAISKRFSEFAEDYEFGEMGYTDEMGITPDGKNISFESYFSESKVYMKAYVSDLYITAGGATFYVSAPIAVNGTFKGIVYAAVDGKELSEIVNKIRVGDDGSAFVLNQAGDTIASDDFNEVLSQRNVQSEAAEDSSLKNLAEIQGKMTALTSGVASYKEDGKNLIVAYYPIPDSEHWSIGVTVNKSEFLSGLWVSVFVTLGFVVVVFILALLMAKKIADSISNPVLTCVERIKLLAQGDVTTEVVTFDLSDETGVLARETSKTVRDLSGFIKDVSSTLTEIANGNLDISFEKEYRGDFAPIGDAIRKIIEEMSMVIGNIQDFAQIVSNGAEQVSNGAQALSQGATEQASAVEQLAATIGDVSHKVKNNAAYAKEASDGVENVNAVVDTSSNQVQTLVAAMKDINNNSQEIEQILETIEDIAFQTNILALNASIEAAKAGAAGRGFSVVAEEVRTLSEKCTEAAQNTAELVQTTIASVGKGSAVVGETAHTLGNVVSATKIITDDINNIFNASNEQAESISEIRSGVDQIASVVQNNSATAEQSAAASIELSEHAKKLAAMVEAFTVNSDYNNGSDNVYTQVGENFNFEDNSFDETTDVSEQEVYFAENDDKYFGGPEEVYSQEKSDTEIDAEEEAEVLDELVAQAMQAGTATQNTQEAESTDNQTAEGVQIEVVEKKQNVFVKAVKKVGSKEFWSKAGKPFVLLATKISGFKAKKAEKNAESDYGKDEEKAARKAVKNAEKAERKAVKNEEKAEKKAVKNEEKAERKAVKSAEKAARKAAKAEEKAQKAEKEAEQNQIEE